jgi:hypothetical protein
VDNSIEPTNYPPIVSITSSSGVYSEGDDVVIEADASDDDGDVVRVEFYAGSTLLGEDTTPPYSYTWTGAVQGTYSLTAKAVDDKNAEMISSSISIIVNSSLPQVSAAVYDDNLAVSWNARFYNGCIGDLECTDEAYEGSQSISLIFPEAWSGLQIYMNSSFLDVSGYNFISFYIHGGSQGAQHTIELQLLDENSIVLNTIELQDYIIANTWTLVSIPLSDFGNPNYISTIRIRNKARVVHPIFYIDKIEFIGD